MDSADTIFGVMFGLVAAVLIIAVFALSERSAHARVAGQCDRVGKVEILDKVYECKPVERGLSNG